jgi:prevent-host-death family protein
MKVSSTQVQNNFGKYLKYVEVHEEVLITKKGKEVAKLVSCDGINTDCLSEEAAEYQTSSWVTYEEYLELVENSEQRFELIDGVIYNMASPSYRHQHAVHELHGAFYIWFKGKSCTPLTSPFDVTLKKSENNICVVQPDILVMCDRNNLDKKGKYKGIPSLAIEVLSTATRSKDMIKKLELYQLCGVKEYWIVDTNREQVLVYTLKDNDISDMKCYSSGKDTFIESDIFEGLKVNVGDVFYSE